MRECCRNCARYSKGQNICCLSDDNILKPHIHHCTNWLMQVQTVFDRITASPEVLAEKLVYKTICVAVNRVTYSCWKSTITDESYRTKEDAIAATVAKLKEMEK